MTSSIASQSVRRDTLRDSCNPLNLKLLSSCVASVATVAIGSEKHPSAITHSGASTHVPSLPTVRSRSRDKGSTLIELTDESPRGTERDAHVVCLDCAEAITVFLRRRPEMFDHNRLQTVSR